MSTKGTDRISGCIVRQRGLTTRIRTQETFHGVLPASRFLREERRIMGGIWSTGIERGIQKMEMRGKGEYRWGRERRMLGAVAIF